MNMYVKRSLAVVALSFLLTIPVIRDDGGGDELIPEDGIPVIVLA